MIRIVLLCLAFAFSAAQADEVQEGVTAYDRGDFGGALSIFKSAADKNHPAAMNKLGVMYARGQGVERNYKVALDWFFRAQALGSSEAMMNLAMIYEEGLGIPKNQALALKYYRESANDGYQPAMARMLRLFEAGGLGMLPDKNGVLYWQAQISERTRRGRLGPWVQPVISSVAKTATDEPLPVKPATKPVNAVSPARVDKRVLLSQKVEQGIEKYKQRELKMFVGSTDARPVLAPYLRALRAQLKTLPGDPFSRAKPDRRVIVVLPIRRDGSVRTIELSSGSGHPAIDARVLASLQSFKRLPPLPDELDKSVDLLEVTIKLPVEPDS